MENIKLEPFLASEEDLSLGVKDEHGVIYSKDGKFLLKCENREIKEYSIKEGTKVICDRAFERCYRLTSVKMPSSGVVSIGKEAFRFCFFLEEINISESVTSIGEYCFAECHALKMMCLPKGLTIIPRCLFLSCRRLESVNIPESITQIEDMAFLGCTYLESVHVDAIKPPKISDEEVFGDIIDSECVLVLHQAAEDAFLELRPWKDFPGPIIIP